MHIEDEFVTALYQLYLDARLKIEQQGAQPVNPFMRQKKDLLNFRIHHPNSEVQKNLANLERLPYTAFGIRQSSSDEIFLVGITQPIYFADRECGQGDPVFGCLGKYAVAVPRASILNQQLSNFHFVRMGRIRDRKRHFHHYALFDTRNPLDSKVDTCWASIGPLMLSALELFNVSLIFEAANFFLTHIDLASKLENPYYTRMTSFEYAVATGQDPQTIYHKYFGEENIDEIF